MKQGVYAASLIPFHDDLSIDCRELFAHCCNLLDKGCEGIVLFGTTGEGSSFSVSERIEALETLISMGLNPKKIILANGSSCIPDTAQLAKAALRHGCPAVLIAPPCFYKNVPEEGVISFYREIIRRAVSPNLRVILYHIPQYSGVPITLKVIGTLLREFPNTVIGIKESEGNLPYAKSVIDAFPNFPLFVGNERHIIEAVHYGAAGSFCGISNLDPQLIASLFEQGKRGLGPNPPQLDAIFEALKGVQFIPAVKAFLAQKNGKTWQAVRPPFIPLSAEQKSAFLSRLPQIPT